VSQVVAIAARNGNRFETLEDEVKEVLHCVSISRMDGWNRPL